MQNYSITETDTQKWSVVWPYIDKVLTVLQCRIQKNWCTVIVAPTITKTDAQKRSVTWPYIDKVIQISLRKITHGIMYKQLQLTASVSRSCRYACLWKLTFLCNFWPLSSIKEVNLISYAVCNMTRNTASKQYGLHLNVSHSV